MSQGSPNPPHNFLNRWEFASLPIRDSHTCLPDSRASKAPISRCAVGTADACDLAGTLLSHTALQTLRLHQCFAPVPAAVCLYCVWTVLILFPRGQSCLHPLPSPGGFCSFHSGAFHVFSPCWHCHCFYILFLLILFHLCEAFLFLCFLGGL